jgi:PAS domain S-box-containing protein
MYINVGRLFEADDVNRKLPSLQETLMDSKKHESEMQQIWSGFPISRKEALSFSLIAGSFILLGALGFLASVYVATPELVWTVRGLGPLALALMAVTSLVLWSRGRVRAVALVLIYGSWLYATVVSAFDGGLRSVTLWFYPPIIMMAAWRLGTGYGSVVAAASVAVCTGFYAAESAGVLPAPPPISAALLLIVEAPVLVFSAFLIAALVRSYRGRLDEVSHLTDRLTRRGLELESSEAKYRELVTNANAIILRMGPDGTVTYFNEFAECFFGYSADEILGRHVVGTIVPPRESESGRDLAQLLAAIVDDPASHRENENENVTRDGRRVFVRWANRAILDKDGRPAGVLCIGHDITGKKQVEKELEQYRHHLEELVFSRTAELAAARDAAEAANRAKSVFLANMSHELRTPMNGIMGMTTLALRRATDPKQIDQLEKSMGAARHLLGVINNVLDISRIEADRLTLEEGDFSLSRVIAETCGTQEAAARAKGLDLVREIAADVPDQLRGDARRLGQVVLNFIDNAVKFSDHGQIRVRASADAQDSHGVQLRIEVADQGMGIGAGQQSRLFEAFTQADDSMTRAHGGTGLGLAISRRIARLMGGDVGVTSQEGLGSTFWLCIPLRRASDNPPAEGATAVTP